MSRSPMRFVSIVVMAFGSVIACAPEAPAPEETSPSRWLKGNLHTHSFWSDGDDYPEPILEGYKERGYDFVALSEHNILAEGERWIDVESHGGVELLERYRHQFGDEWVETREEDGTLVVRLKTLAEYRTLFEEEERFLVLEGEEITDGFEAKPVHVNATNLRELITPQGGGSVAEVMQNNVDAVLEQRKRTGRLMFPHINHPNFGWAVKVEDLIALEGEKFFEVYNGHPLVHNEGDDLRPSTERMWDILLAERLSQGREVLYGVAVDDSHNYHELDSEHSNPFRGWVMARAASLTPGAIIEAMERGDFYGSSGVQLDDVRVGNTEISIAIRGEEGVAYTTRFIGTRRGYDRSTEAVRGDDASVLYRYSDDIGEILDEVLGNRPSYTFKGDEIYVRAKIVSSKLKENPYREGEHESAWVQPVVLHRE
ncbi:MAG TPA: histidinol-phosphatase [Vicinamibacteria bacterium]|nr:histidinol-phosphatase [Vicinamibacteria bacterium]